MACASVSPSAMTPISAPSTPGKAAAVILSSAGSASSTDQFFSAASAQMKRSSTPGAAAVDSSTSCAPWNHPENSNRRSRDLGLRTVEVSPSSTGAVPTAPAAPNALRSTMRRCRVPSSSGVHSAPSLRWCPGLQSLRHSVPSVGRSTSSRKVTRPSATKASATARCSASSASSSASSICTSSIDWPAPSCPSSRAGGRLARTVCSPMRPTIAAFPARSRRR
jgi:hypothetical protein